MRLAIATGRGIHLVEDERTVEALRAPIRCIARDPEDPTHLVAGGDGVWRSGDGGVAWREIAPLPHPAFSVAIGHGRYFAGTEPSSLYRSDDRGETWHDLAALREIPSAPTWSFPPRPWTSHVRWIGLDPHDPGVILAGIELGGVMRSSDGGATWHDPGAGVRAGAPADLRGRLSPTASRNAVPGRAGAHRDCHALAFHPTAPGRCYEAAGGGVAWSHDGGDSWTRLDRGRDRHYCWGLAVDPEDPDLFYVSAAPGPYEAHYRAGTADAAIYRYQGRWTRLTNGLPDPIPTLPTALATDRGGTVYAVLRDGALYRSRDRGETWETLPATVPGAEAMVVI